MYKALSLAVLCAALSSATFCQRAEAFHFCCHRGYYAAFPPCCFVPGCGSCYGSWVGCPTACTVGGHHCCLGHWLRNCFAAHHACGWSACRSCGWGCGSCGYGCGSCDFACGGGCDGYSGCSSGCAGCAGGDQVQTYGEEVRGNMISDGPSPAPEPTPDASTSNRPRWRGLPYRLVSNVRQSGSAAFEKGLQSFRSRSLSDALSSFDAATSAEPTNAVYHYYRALTLYDLNGADAAGDALQQAVEIERSEPIANWGKRMERVQGKSRAWVENARRAAGLTR